MIYWRIRTGLKSAIQVPDNLFIAPTLDRYDPLHVIPHILGKGNVTSGYSEQVYSPPAIRLGSLEYRGQNNYWIPQTYYYQMGGVFLTQSDGNITYKLPPGISLHYVNDPVITKKIVTVNVNALAIDPNNRGIVGGSNSISGQDPGLTRSVHLPYANGIPNTKWITITVNTTDNQSRVMWKNYFDYTASVAGVPNYSTKTEGNETSVTIQGFDTADRWNDINVIAATGKFSTTIHGSGALS